MDLLLVKSTIRPMAAAGLAVLVLAGCGTSSGHGATSSRAASSSARSASATVTTPAAHQQTAAKADPAARRCYARKDESGDVIVRVKSHGAPAVAQRLSGVWVWNVTLGKCLTSAQMVIATAPAAPGSCTWVGYVADNPGYDVNAMPAPPLRHVAASAGGSC